MKQIFRLGFVPLLVTIQASAQVNYHFDLGKRGPAITPDHYGIFYEEINHAGEGGLYAELIRNRSFEDNSSQPDSWHTLGSASMSLVTANLLNVNQGHALRLSVRAANGGVYNDGFWGMGIVNGQEYKVSFWMRAETSYEGHVSAELQSASGENLGSADISVKADNEWKKYTATIVATGDAKQGRFALRCSKAGAVVLDMVSLFPPTFNGRENGVRPDLAQMMKDLRPAFMRFPGGCYIEGNWVNNRDNRYEWKKTIGPVEERPGHDNANWGYRVCDGQGYHEFLELCEDLGAAPMFVVNMGFGHGWQVEYTNIQPYIQEALDAIEYANGDVSTYYGSLRAKNGHPKPFNMKYLEIGNENESYDHYADRYYEFYKAIKSRWPDLHLIVNGNWTYSYPAEIQDEHFYTTPQWFIGQYGRYDNYSRSSTKIYIGEYAVTENYGTYGNLNAAIGEAVFMQGMENNSDVCAMASYAPIFANENNVAWRPDMIRFNSYMSYGTPSYYVQRMFANNVGKVNVKWTEDNNKRSLDDAHGAFGIGTWSTSAVFSNLEVTDNNGNVIKGTDTRDADWAAMNGKWAFDGGTFTQTDEKANNVTYMYLKPVDDQKMTLGVNARKTGGDEGFLIVLDYKDSQNYVWWNVGGWGNTAHGIEQCINGERVTLAKVKGSLETDRDYKIKVEKEGKHLAFYLDGTKIHEADLRDYDGGRKLYASSSIDDESGDLIIKLVNPYESAVPTVLGFANGKVSDGTVEVLTSASGNDENTTSNPNAVVPSTQSISVDDDHTLHYTVPAYSVNVIKLRASDVSISEDVATLPKPAVNYSFESGEAVDDQGLYPATLMGKASVITTSDGNHVLSTGEIGGRGYLDLGTAMPKAVLGSASDYTISIDILNKMDNNLGSYSWAYAFANGTNQYVGLINAAGNANWYYETKGSVTESLRSGAALSCNNWHNVTYAQKNQQGTLYIDGRAVKTSDVKNSVSSIIRNITSACIGKSPFSADAIMENALFDNLKIFDEALTAEQVALLAKDATSREQTVDLDGISYIQDFRNLVDEVANYVDDAVDDALASAYAAADKEKASNALSVVKPLYEKLQAAVADYQNGQLLKAKSGEKANLTFLITNSSFTRNNVGWNGQGLSTVKTDDGFAYESYDNDTFEQYDKNFDVYQILRGLPAGVYTLHANAFYRAGNRPVGYNAYKTQKNTIYNMVLYMNDQEAPVANLYSDAEAYTFSPYTYPDNLAAASKALKTDGRYDANSVTAVVKDGDELRLGVKKLSKVASDWGAYTHFQLIYEGTETSIGGVRESTADGKVYDLQGRQLKGAPSKGLYIQDGKTVYKSSVE